MRLRLLILLLLVGGTAFSQERDSTSRFRHLLSLQFGLNQVKDENLHPKVSTGTITEVSYGFERRKSKNWQKFHFTLGYSRLKTTFEDLSKSMNLVIGVGYSMGFKLTRGGKFNYYLGPEATLAYNACFFPNWDDSHLYWADYLSAGARNTFSVRFKNNNEWVTDVSIPLFSLFSRPDLYRPYKIDDTDAGGIISSLNSQITAAHLTNVFFVNFQTEWRFPVFRTKTQAFTYSLHWARVKDPDGNPFNQLTNQIGLKLFL
jgi:hypothetical protein